MTNDCKPKLLTIKKIFFLLLVSFTLVACSAQTKLTPGELKGHHDRFIIENLDESFDTLKKIVVYSKSNKYNNGIPYSAAERDPRFLPMNRKTDIHVDDNVTRKIVFDVLSAKLNALHHNKERMGIILAFDTKGSVVNLIYDFKANTIITLQDVENIDEEIRSKVHAVFTGTQYKYYNAISHNMKDISF